MPPVTDNGAATPNLALRESVEATRRGVAALQVDVDALGRESRRTGDACERIDATLNSLLGIEQEKLAHKKRLQEKQWAFILDNWKIIAFVCAVLWMPEAVPSIVHALVPGLSGQQQVVVLPVSTAAGLEQPVVEEIPE